eukprot:TRINITY_DN112607_c0_g1_i1.p1 TRINITY_DN112607_c0_g1~~TRINITY_DN112607_c0_g1_i1.p1  ORF type:complete len:257 (+),score=33.97 TRINITY_DN112607_c0_g1_i1:55-825(+)
MPAVEYRTEGRIGIFTLNRPKQRNAVNADVAREMEAHLDTFEKDQNVWVGIITANGPVFCAGADLKAFGSGLQTERGGFAGLVKRKRIKPLIAAVDGPALAGGTEVVLACDLVVASEKAQFGLPEVKRCLAAAAGGLFTLPRRMPYYVAMETVLTGEPISVQRAYSLGFVNRLVAPGTVFEAAKELADKICENAPTAVSASRNVVERSQFTNDEQGWELSAEAAQQCISNPDFQEGLLAFRQKRKPNWTGTPPAKL